MSEVSNSLGHEGGGKPTKKSSLFFVFFVIVVALVFGGSGGDVPAARAVSGVGQRNGNAGGTDGGGHSPDVTGHGEDLVLPGTLQAYVESPIYARTNGYLRKWYHDIGSRVTKGELLADIDTPEVDQQLMQAKADLVTAQANEHLSQITEARYSDLLKTDGVSKQEVDNATGDLAAKQRHSAIVRSQCAAAGGTEVVSNRCMRRSAE